MRDQCCSLFAGEGSRQYLIDEQVVPARYRRARSFVEAAVTQDWNSGSSLAIVDLGCGPGWLFLCPKARERSVTYVGVDRSEGMLLAARDSGKGVNPKPAFLHADIFAAGAPEAVRRLIPRHADAIVLVFGMVLHHYRPQHWLQLLKRWMALKPTRIVCYDLFSCESVASNTNALEIELADIRMMGGRDGAEANSTFSEHHYRRENDPLPLSTAFDIFRTVAPMCDVVYRDGQVGVVVAEC